MPLQVLSKHFTDHSHSQQKSQAKDRPSKLHHHKPKPGVLVLEYHGDRSHTRKDRERSTSKRYAKCCECQIWKSKLKEQERHFRQLVEIHHQEMIGLSKTNQQLRQELDRLEARARQAEDELQRLKDEASYCSSIEVEGNSQAENAYNEFPELSPIGEARGIASVKKLKGGQSSTFSELLVVTPQASSLGPNPFEAGEKQKALRSEFERLMGECTSAKNRSKKSVLRKQLAAIAKQLSLFEPDSVMQ